MHRLPNIRSLATPGMKCPGICMSDQAGVMHVFPCRWRGLESPLLPPLLGRCVLLPVQCYDGVNHLTIGGWGHSLPADGVT